MKPTPLVLIATFLGGCIGTGFRTLFGFGFDTVTALWLVNLVGTAMLAIGNVLANRPSAKFNRPEAQAFWSVGIAGGFTTMSGLFTLLTYTQAGWLSFFGPVMMIAMMLAGLATYGLTHWVASRLLIGETK
ncbi:MAG: hypothetical protein ACKORF_02215 [Micrococcales bacterium]